MNKLDLNKILDRENIYNEVKSILHNIQKNDSHDQIKRDFTYTEIRGPVKRNL